MRKAASRRRRRARSLGVSGIADGRMYIARRSPRWGGIGTLTIAGLVVGAIGGVIVGVTTQSPAFAACESTLLIILTCILLLLDQNFSLPPRLRTLERALADDELYEFLVTATDCTEQVAEYVFEYPAVEKLMNERIHALFRQSARDFRALERGNIVVEGTGGNIQTLDGVLGVGFEEIDFAIQCLQLFSESMLAVSYQEHAFWADRAGEEYLNRQRIRIQELGPGAPDAPRITRVFLFDSEEEVRQQEGILKKQHDAGISVRIIKSLEGIREPEDFILYDSDYVRFAASLDHAGFEKSATLSLDQDLIFTYSGKFSQLLWRSEPLSNFFSGLTSPTENDGKRRRRFRVPLGFKVGRGREKSDGSGSSSSLPPEIPPTRSAQPSFGQSQGAQPSAEENGDGEAVAVDQEAAPPVAESSSMDEDQNAARD